MTTTTTTPSSNSSIFRSKNVYGSSDDAVLVTAPRILNESSDNNNLAIVEAETYQDVSTSNNGVSPLRWLLESGLGIGAKPTKEQELDEFVGSNRLDANLVQINSPIVRRDVVDSFDICREYSYSGDDEDETELNKLYFNDSGPQLSSTNAALLSKMSKVGTYMLGKTYHPIHDYNIRRSDESSLFWFTYRCDFPCIEPYGITSDAGWGCMLRALQMMCGQALRLHYKSRDWKPPASLQQRRLDPFLRSLLTWFADFPSSTESLYSLHNMVATGHAKYDKLPGEWYGPGTACYVLRDLVALHEKNQQKQKPVFRVHVAAGGTVYRDAIDETMVKDLKSKLENEKQKFAQMLPPPAHPLDVAWDEELLDPFSDSSLLARSSKLQWDTALLLLIPLRLGLKNFNQEYVEAVAHTFSLPQSVGVLGGRPRGARWFYGALSDGSKIFGLDPHTVQSAPKRRTALVNGVQSSVVELCDEYLRSVHTTYPEVFSLPKMDPSIALGFYCRDRKDLDFVFTSLRQWKEAHLSSPDLFTVADRMPNYSLVASSFDCNISNSYHASVESDEDDEKVIDDDEFIML
jgi:cysteine protease ATG4